LEDEVSKFNEFMKRVDKVITKASGIGFGVHDFADAPWRDLFDDTNGEADDEAICECLAEYDDIFREALAINKQFPNQ
jgi:hypothetical protein